MHIERQRVERFVEQTAQRRHWIVNPDTAFVSDIIDGLYKNVNHYEYFLCPCRDSKGTKPHDQDVICPCDYAELDIAQYGHCFCGLYFSKSFNDSGETAEGIPERRPE